MLSKVRPHHTQKLSPQFSHGIEWCLQTRKYGWGILDITERQVLSFSDKY